MKPSRSLRQRSTTFLEDSPDEQSPFDPGSRHGPGPGSRCESVQSDSSKNLIFEFKEENFEEQSPFDPGSRPGSRCESVQSDSSKNIIFEFKEENFEEQRDPGPEEQDDDLIRLEENVLIYVKEQLQGILRLLASDYTEYCEQNSRAVLDITMDCLSRMKQEKLLRRLQTRSTFGVCRDIVQKHLQQKVSRVLEGVAKPGHSAPLTQIYTELYITEGGVSEVNQEHEVRLMESVPRRPSAPETTITCEDMFKPRPHSPQPIRALLTKGVAGVGKTVLTQKFSLDWAEGRAHQHLQLLFPFSFRELNVLKGRRFSLVGLIKHFFSPSKDLCSFENLQVLLILDGLDECRLPLDFGSSHVLSDPTESVSLDLLLVNLIRGNLLPSARLWITTRPAAANWIPPECVSMVTEVRGFTNAQKKEYFRKKFRDERQATAIISHIKSVRSLHIMCHIPVFCWILSTVLQKRLEQTEEPELPRSLTQMYTHFLVVQAKIHNIKCQQGSGSELCWTPQTREMVMSLGKLAFEQLLRGNLIFYDCDLSECGLDAEAASVYSGVFTQVFREEPGLYEDKVYCFIHLSVQEFLAALHVHQTFYSSGENLLKTPHAYENQLKFPHSNENQLKFPHSNENQLKFPLSYENQLKTPYSSENLLKTPHSSESKSHFYCSAVDQALQSPNGHLDLFLRFLLGLSLPTNQRLLSGLLTETESDTRIVKYIKDRLNEKGLSAEGSMNLLHCLMELNDLSLVEKIQKYMRKGEFSWMRLPGQWSALSFVLMSSDSDLQDFDLRKYLASETALLGLLPVVRASTKALLRSCGLSPSSCGRLAKVLSSSSLTHLDLSNNNLQDSGVELLCSGLKSAPCGLHALKLSGCLISERGGAALASALSPAPSHLRELDLSYNHPGGSSELLKALQDDPHCPLVDLRLDPAGEQWMVPGLRKYSCDFSLDPNTAHRDLKLSEDNRTATKGTEEQPSPDSEDRATEEQPSPDCEDQATEEVLNQSRVLSSTGLRGRCYWEVDWRGWRGIDIAVSQRSRGERREETGGRIEERGEGKEERGEGEEERGEGKEERGERREGRRDSEERGECEERGDRDEGGHSQKRGEIEERKEGKEVREIKERGERSEDRGDHKERGERSEERGDHKVIGDHEERGERSEDRGDHEERGERSKERGDHEVIRDHEERGERSEDRGDHELIGDHEERGERSEERGDSEDLGFGDDPCSWSLRVCEGSYSFYHNSRRTVLRPLPSSFSPSGRVSVFLDSEAGSLSFYHVPAQGNLLHLHTCTSSFSEPVFPGFGLRSGGDSVSVVDLSGAPPAGSK